jgi:hypothetical protein
MTGKIRRFMGTPKISKIEDPRLKIPDSDRGGLVTVLKLQVA